MSHCTNLSSHQSFAALEQTHHSFSCAALPFRLVLYWDPIRLWHTGCEGPHTSLSPPKRNPLPVFLSVSVLRWTVKVSKFAKINRPEHGIAHTTVATSSTSCFREAREAREPARGLYTFEVSLAPAEERTKPAPLFELEGASNASRKSAYACLRVEQSTSLEQAAHNIPLLHVPLLHVVWPLLLLLPSLSWIFSLCGQ